MAKKSKVEKETRRLMEGMADLVKRKGNRYKFKTGKKKQIRKIKRKCVCWIIRKGEKCPTVQTDTANPMNWKCTICGSSFPKRPATMEEYFKDINGFISYIDQAKFFSVMMGGNAEDTKLFLRMKSDSIRFRKVLKNVIKNINKRQKWEDRKEKSDSLDQFDSYAGFNYRS